MIKLTKEARDEKVRYLLEKNIAYTFDDLVTVVEILRSEGGCPWDMEQTHKSIRNDFIEETYEVIEAIDTDDPVLLREPSYEDNKRVTLDQFNSKMDNSKFVTGKRIGYEFNVDDI